MRGVEGQQSGLDNDHRRCRVGGRSKSSVTDLPQIACKEWQIADNLENIETPRVLTLAVKRPHFPVDLVVLGLIESWGLGNRRGSRLSHFRVKSIKSDGSFFFSSSLNIGLCMRRLLRRVLSRALRTSMYSKLRVRSNLANRPGIESLEARVFPAVLGVADMSPVIAAEANSTGTSHPIMGPYDGTYRVSETLVLTTYTYAGGQVTTTETTVTNSYTFKIIGEDVYTTDDGTQEPSGLGYFFGDHVGLDLHRPRLSSFPFESHRLEGTISSTHGGYMMSGTSDFFGADVFADPAANNDHVYGVGTWETISDEGVGNVAIDQVRFTGPHDIPSANVTFDWTYISTSPPTASDRFTATLYYSSDPSFDDGDIKVGKSLNIAVHYKTDSGTATFDFGTKKPLKPNKTRPYLLVVLDDQKRDDDPSDNVGSVILQYLDIKTIGAEANDPRKKGAWLSTLMHSSTFNLDASQFFDDSNFEIESRRIGKLRPGETDDWMPFVEGEAQNNSGGQTISGTHRLAGTFEFRVSAELNGMRFSSDNYSGNKKPAALPQIQVRYPTVDEIRQSDLFAEPLVLDGARELWAQNLRYFANSYDADTHTASVREFDSWVVLDTRDGSYYMSNVVAGDPRPATYQGQMKDGDVIANVDPGDPPPDEERADGTGRYLVANFHTHTPLIGGTDTGFPFSRPAGPSGGDTKWLKSFRGAIIPGLVYDFVGVDIVGSTKWVNDSVYTNLPDDVFLAPAKVFDFNTDVSNRRVGNLDK
jgi:hypothetical protein